MMDRLGAKRSAETGETSEASAHAQRRLEGVNPKEKQTPDKKQPVKTRK
jgi:hypothetical protein